MNIGYIFVRFYRYSGPYLTPGAQRSAVSLLVSDQRSCHFHAQRPRCVSSKCTCTHLCAHGRVRLKMRCGQIHCWRIVILRQQKAIAPLWLRLNGLMCGCISLERIPTPGRATNVSKRLRVKGEHIKWSTGEAPCSTACVTPCQAHQPVSVPGTLGLVRYGVLHLQMT